MEGSSAPEKLPRTCVDVICVIGVLQGCPGVEILQGVCVRAWDVSEMCCKIIQVLRYCRGKCQRVGCVGYVLQAYSGVLRRRQS